MKPPPALAVLKVGGSLLDWPRLPSRLTEFLQAARDRSPASRTLLIAGGGPTVDVIRALDHVHRLSPEAAHQLALDGLDLTASILSALLPDSVVVDRIDLLIEAWKTLRTPILAPRRVFEQIERDCSDALPQNWSVTSDTIAARIAAHLDAECLVLLKSAPWLGPATVKAAARLGLVDPLFPAAVRALRQVEYVNLRGESLEPVVLRS